MQDQPDVIRINDVDYLTDIGVIRLYAETFNEDLSALLRDEDIRQCVGSTYARPINLMQSDSDNDIADQAATLAYGLGANHCFKDGNKRIAWIVMAAFLEGNGYTVHHIAARTRATWILYYCTMTRDYHPLANILRRHARQIPP